jgi:hypothetical protein
VVAALAVAPCAPILDGLVFPLPLLHPANDTMIMPVLISFAVNALVIGVFMFVFLMHILKNLK